MANQHKFSEFLPFGETVNRPRVGVSSKYYRILIEGNGFDANSKAVINGVETETEFVRTNTLRAKIPSGKLGALGRSALQTRGLNGAVSNVFNF